MTTLVVPHTFGEQLAIVDLLVELEKAGLPIVPTIWLDPERNFDATLCGTGNDGCAGDVRLYDWEQNGHGISRPVLFTARNGAVLSGQVWATKSGPKARPGVVPSSSSRPERSMVEVAMCSLGTAVGTTDSRSGASPIRTS